MKTINKQKITLVALFVVLFYVLEVEDRTLVLDKYGLAVGGAIHD